MQPKRFLFNLKIDFSDTLGADVTDTTSNAPNAKQVLENQEGCGVRGSEGTRIIGGSPIKKHEYPWLCSLKLKGGHSHFGLPSTNNLSWGCTLLQ